MPAGAAKERASRRAKPIYETGEHGENGTFIDGSFSWRESRVEGSIQRGEGIADRTKFTVNVRTTLSEKDFRDVVWLMVERDASLRPAEVWGLDHKASIVLLTDEIDLFMDALRAAVARARADGVVPITRLQAEGELVR